MSHRQKPLEAVGPSGSNVIRGVASPDGFPDRVRAPDEIERVPSPVRRELQLVRIQSVNGGEDVDRGRRGTELPCVGQDQSDAAFPAAPGSGYF